MMEKQEQSSQAQSNWLLFFLFLLFICHKNTNKLNFQEIDPIDLNKKSKLLSRIKGYMDPQERYVIHSAEIILQIIARIKTLIDLPQTETSEMGYSTLSLEDKKRNMLTDLSEFLENEISEPMLADEAKEKAVELKKLASILKIISSLKSREKMNELDIMEVVQPFVDKEQEDSLMRMIQTFKVMDDMKETDIEPIN